MRTEVVALSLDKVCGDNFRAVTVEEGKGGAERGSRDTPEDGLRDDTSPAGLGLVCGCDGMGSV